MHPAKNVHCMCSDGVAAAQAAEGAIELWVAIPAILENQQELQQKQQNNPIIIFSFFYTPELDNSSK